MLSSIGTFDGLSDLTMTENHNVPLSRSMFVSLLGVVCGMSVIFLFSSSFCSLRKWQPRMT